MIIEGKECSQVFCEKCGSQYLAVLVVKDGIDPDAYECTDCGHMMWNN